MSPRHFLTSVGMMKNFVDARIVLMDRITVLASHFEYGDKVKRYVFSHFHSYFWCCRFILKFVFHGKDKQKKKHIHKTLDSSWTQWSTICALLPFLIHSWLVIQRFTISWSNKETHVWVSIAIILIVSELQSSSGLKDSTSSQPKFIDKK